MYPGLVNNTTTIWFQRWPKEALVEVSHFYLAKVVFQEDLDEQERLRKEEEARIKAEEEAKKRGKESRRDKAKREKEEAKKREEEEK